MDGKPIATKGSFWLGKGAGADSRQKSKIHHTSVKEEDGPRGSNIDSVQGAKHLAIKTEERDDPRIHMMYRETELSEGSSDSSSESSSDVFEESASDFPEIMAEIEEQRKEKEKRWVEKQLRKRKQPGPISYRLVWIRGWRAAFKKRRVESPKRELKTEKEENKEAV